VKFQLRTVVAIGLRSRPPAFTRWYPDRVKKLVVSSPATGGDKASGGRLLSRAEGVERDGMRPFADPSGLSLTLGTRV
jgi:hypothetical protein